MNESEIPIDPISGEKSDPSKKIFSWRKLETSLKNAATATGTGIQYLYTAGSNHKHFAVPILNGLIGDKLADMNDRRAISMSFRIKEKDVSVPDLQIKEKLKEKNNTVAIFVHGLMSDEVLWQFPVNSKEEGYALHLERDLNILPLFIRYNTGMHISQNGRAFSNLIQELVNFYGKDIHRIIIVAHSMGGLVSRSAGYYANLQNQDWPLKLKSLVLLGVPNDGSFLEKFGHLTTFLLKNIWNFHTKLIAKIADERSNGIKDLRWGFLTDDDWQNENANALLNVKRKDVKPLPGVKYNIIVGTVSENDTSFVSMYIGDGLVGKKSATGEIFYRSADNNNYLTFHSFPKVSHLKLLANPQVYEYMKSQIQQNL